MRVFIPAFYGLVVSIVFLGLVILLGGSMALAILVGFLVGFGATWFGVEVEEAR